MQSPNGWTFLSSKHPGCWGYSLGLFIFSRILLGNSKQGKARYKQLAGEAIIYFKYGEWKLNDEDDTGGWCYEARPDTSSAMYPPVSSWITAVPRYGEAPSVRLGCCHDIEEGDSVTILLVDSAVDWSGCPESEGNRWPRVD